MGWLGCEVGVSSSIREEARTRVHGQLELLSEAKVSELEILLNYKFQNKGLLVEALTHASCRRHSGDCYQVNSSVSLLSVSLNPVWLAENKLPVALTMGFVDAEAGVFRRRCA